MNYCDLYERLSEIDIDEILCRFILQRKSSVVLHVIKKYQN
jgi:hypothetical protein